MRQGWLLSVSIAAVGLLSGCGGKSVQAAAPTNVLVLEVGGQQPSLRASLVAMGRTVAPGKALRPRTMADILDPAGPGGGEQGGGAQEGRDQEGGEQDPTVPSDGPSDAPPEVTPDPPAESQWVIVKLPKNETLIHLSRRYLGDGRRFGEIMTWNGWSEPDTRRLRDGQDVKIKRSEMR